MRKKRAQIGKLDNIIDYRGKLGDAATDTSAYDDKGSLTRLYLPLLVYLRQILCTSSAILGFRSCQLNDCLSKLGTC